ncbi:hypothetical protein OHA37_33250 [Streptomyces sp. NBC_00335]|uniref:hypothetical protein n=1 Tax=unclassified Streptomyces TaxID=2593676 RepID=UPI00224C99B3|nr:MULTISPECIES: hypothetical protein [unclassified Streptomyces]MCX5408708.1 hypothetical protein [Streptomyces sp. NBC_00086]
MAYAKSLKILLALLAGAALAGCGSAVQSAAPSGRTQVRSDHYERFQGRPSPEDLKRYGLPIPGDVQAVEHWKYKSSGAGMDLWVRFEATQAQLDQFLRNLGQSELDMLPGHSPFDSKDEAKLGWDIQSGPDVSGLAIPIPDSDLHGTYRQVAVDRRGDSLVMVYVSSATT